MSTANFTPTSITTSTTATSTAKILVGCSMSLAHGVANAFILLHQTYGGNAMQLTLGNLDSAPVASIADDDAAKAKRIIAKHGFYVVIHGKYRYNFCRRATMPGWSWQSTSLAKELIEANKLGADVIIHQGKNLPELGLTKTEAHQVFADNIVSVLRSAPGTNRIILENSARQGTECGYSLTALSEIYQMIPVEYRARIGFCIDLCHVFVAGELDVRRADLVEKYFAEFEELFTMKPTVIHFNDSRVPFNGANDHHAALLEGYIGNPELEGNRAGLKQVAQYCASNGVPMILETGGDYMKEIALIKSFV